MCRLGFVKEMCDGRGGVSRGQREWNVPGTHDAMDEGEVCEGIDES